MGRRIRRNYFWILLIQTAAYLGDPDFYPKLGNHLAGAEDGYFVEVRPNFWQDQFGIVWNRTIDKDIGNVAEITLKSPDLGGYTFPTPDYADNAAGYARLDFHMTEPLDKDALTAGIARLAEAVAAERRQEERKQPVD